MIGGLEHLLFFHNIWDNPSQLTIFFMVKTTNQIYSRYILANYAPIVFQLTPHYNPCGWQTSPFSQCLLVNPRQVAVDTAREMLKLLEP